MLTDEQLLETFGLWENPTARLAKDAIAGLRRVEAAARAECAAEIEAHAAERYESDGSDCVALQYHDGDIALALRLRAEALREPKRAAEVADKLARSFLNNGQFTLGQKRKP